ncbi:uncharacterized protein [Ptychodera flava]|uniref:uncharacterized protein n=1 Tax=Ptychodera flava TaxID=63121 RepID=UPI003969DFD7
MKTSERITSLITVILITWTEVNSLLMVKEDSFVITGPESLTFSPYYYTDFTFSVNLYIQSGGDEFDSDIVSQFTFFFSNYDTDIKTNDGHIGSAYALSMGQSPEDIPIPPEGVNITGWTVAMRPDLGNCHHYKYICFTPASIVSCFDATDMIDCNSTVTLGNSTVNLATGCDGGNALSAAGLIVAMATLLQLASYISGQG